MMISKFHRYTLCTGRIPPPQGCSNHNFWFLTSPTSGHLACIGCSSQVNPYSNSGAAHHTHSYLRWLCLNHNIIKWSNTATQPPHVVGLLFLSMQYLLGISTDVVALELTILQVIILSTTIILSFDLYTNMVTAK